MPTPTIKGLAKRAAKRLLESMDPIARLKYRWITGFDRPIPPMAFRVRTAARWIAPFIDGGKKCSTALESALHQTTGKRIYDFQNVLDFGCGCGRTILQWDLPALRKLIACDVDGPAIAWMKQAYDGTKYSQLSFMHTRFDPPLPFPNDHFDLIYSVSIFSHLSGEDERTWLTELARVLCPGGIALITVQGHSAVKRFPEMFGAARWAELWNGHDLAAESFVFLAIPPQPGAGPTPGIESPNRAVSYGLTFMNRQHIEREWGKPPWELLNVFEGTVDDLQDVVVMKKRGI